MNANIPHHDDLDWLKLSVQIHAQMSLGGFHDFKKEDVMSQFWSPRWFIQLDPGLVANVFAPLLWPFIVEFRGQVQTVGPPASTMSISILRACP